MKENDNPKRLGQTAIFDASEIGKFLHARRKELGYTQKQIAALMGVSPRLIGEIERGKKTVGVQKILDLATGLGVDVLLSVRGR